LSYPCHTAKSGGHHAGLSSEELAQKPVLHSFRSEV